MHHFLAVNHYPTVVYFAMWQWTKLHSAKETGADDTALGLRTDFLVQICFLIEDCTPRR